MVAGITWGTDGDAGWGRVMVTSSTALDTETEELGWLEPWGLVTVTPSGVLGAKAKWDGDGVGVTVGTLCKASKASNAVG
jgi:hypothetical protein